MHSQEVFYPPPHPCYTSDVGCQDPAGYFFFGPPTLSNWQNPLGSLECWGWVRLLVSRQLGWSANMSLGYSLSRLQETVLKPLPAPRGLPTDCRTAKTVSFHNPIALSSPPMLAPQ